jgi:hypothetical protein
LGSTVVIERVSASDVTGRTLLAVDTSGDVKGTLYYWGTPQLEHDGNIITIPDLQIANETKMALEEIKSGYWQMVNDELQPRLRQASTIDLSQRIGTGLERPTQVGPALDGFAVGETGSRASRQHEGGIGRRRLTGGHGKCRWAAADQAGVENRRHAPSVC